MSGERRDRDEFRRLLKGHRERRRWSQERLANEAEMDHSLVSRLEGGSRTPTPEAVAKLCGALDLGGAEADDLWLAAGLLPPGLDEGTLREAVRLAREASETEIKAALRLIATVREGAGEPSGRREGVTGVRVLASGASQVTR